MKTKQTEQKEVGKIKLSDNQDLVTSLELDRQTGIIWLDRGPQAEYRYI